MGSDLVAAPSELILGGQKCGKSRRAELLARHWLLASANHRAVLVASGQAYDEEMRERIARHQRDRTVRVPGMTTLEEPLRLAEQINEASHPQTLLVIDCLTLWLTNLLMPADGFASAVSPAGLAEHTGQLCQAIQTARGPLVLVSNEIGLGVIPMGREVRAFVDALGSLNQQVAQVCQRVTLMAAGLPLTLKGTP